MVLKFLWRATKNLEKPKLFQKKNKVGGLEYLSSEFTIEAESKTAWV